MKGTFWEFWLQQNSDLQNKIYERVRLLGDPTEQEKIRTTGILMLNGVKTIHKC